MKLFTIGDSISQGFMSLAAARTDLAFSALIAKAMRIAGTREYRIPTWPKGGHPLNVEILLRRLEKLAGTDVNVLEWPLVLGRVASFIDEVEDYYERGPGRPSVPDPSGEPFFHNIAVRGYDVADAWLTSPELCREEIRKETKLFFDDGVFALPSAGFYRTALNVLNPSRDRKFDRYTALDWLKHHHTSRSDSEGVENLILWLGANNALGPVVDLKIDATNGPRSDYRPGLGQTERARFNLWSPQDFETDYKKLVDEVNAIMTLRDTDWKVFVATVPAVTIAPLAKGVGDGMIREDPFGVLKDGAKYYKYYTYFMFDEEYAHKSDVKITREQAYTVDSYIAEYNKAIEKLVAAANKDLGRERYHVVDICGALLKAAYKRNSERPIYDFPDEVRGRFPMVDTRYYHATRNGVLEQGGIFSLDGVHPSAIGQGLVAHEFMMVMNKVRRTRLRVDWDEVYADDDLYTDPIRIMPWLRSQERLAKLFLNINRGFSKRPQP